MKLECLLLSLRFFDQNQTLDFLQIHRLHSAIAIFLPNFSLKMFSNAPFFGGFLFFQEFLNTFDFLFFTQAFRIISSVGVNAGVF